jgi:hypothetical protein
VGASLTLLVGPDAMEGQWFVAKLCAAASCFVLVCASLIVEAIEKDRDRSVGR